MPIYHTDANCGRWKSACPPHTHRRACTRAHKRTRTRTNSSLAQGVASLAAFGHIFVSPAMDERPRRSSSSSSFDGPPALPSEEPVEVGLSCPSAIGLVAQHDAEYFYLKGLVIEKSTKVLAPSSLPSPSAQRQLPPQPQPLPPSTQTSTFALGPCLGLDLEVLSSWPSPAQWPQSDQH